MVISRSSLGRTLVVPPEVTLIVSMCHVLGEAVLSTSPTLIGCWIGDRQRSIARREPSRYLR
jgi:hypothetical protein